MMEMQKLDNGVYDSVVEFMSAVYTDKLVNPQNVDGRDHYAGNDCDHRDWYGADCRTGKQVEQKLKEGWPEGRAKCEAMLAKIDTSSLTPIDRRRRFARSDQGDMVDMDYVYRGELDRAWHTTKRTPAYGPQKVDILANMLCHGGESADVLFWRGAAAVALADKLEEAGYMVRIVVGFGGEYQTSEKVSCRITVKEHGMPMDLATASAVTMPGFFRAMGHAWIAVKCEGRNHGSGISVKQCRYEEGELLLSHEVRDERTAMAWVKKQIDAINEAQMQGVAA